MPRHDPSEDETLAGRIVPAYDAALPNLIGRYHVIEKIGEGGMGTVLKAEQRAPIRRLVAVKVIKLGLDSRSVLARFQAEQQALAVMDHPNIARVLDAGMTEGGRAYFVMEFVPGEPITRYCDRQKFNVRQRMELFREVCSAVQHAHTKGVIHRDLKPDNVLVSVKEGQPTIKVIDFGVAKAVQGRLADETYNTEQGQIIGTPAYMSPEQAEMSNLDIDTRTDIYSLGVMLYELLTGSLPIESATLRAASYFEIQRMIREVPPPRLSTRLSSLGDEAAALIAEKRHTQLPQLTNQLRGELGWIPLKALRKDRTERYQTAAEFEQDITNYLGDLPLAAGPESTVYRLRKLLSRNKLAVIGSVAAILLLIAGISAYIVEIRSEQGKTERARQFAEKLAADKTVLADSNAKLAHVAESERADALRQKEIADDRRRAAELEIAKGLSNLAATGPDSRTAKQTYIESRNAFIRLGHPTAFADWGLAAEWKYSPEAIETLSAGPAGLRCVSVKPGSFTAVSGGDDGAVRLWSLFLGRQTKCLAGHHGIVRAVAFSPDGSRIASAGDDGTLRIWDPDGGNCLRVIDDRQGAIPPSLSCRKESESCPPEAMGPYIFGTSKTERS